MDVFHGTSQNFAKEILAKGVDVTLGGGELGQGFYSGERLHDAKAWAFNCHGDRKKNVVQLSVPANDILALNLVILNRNQAKYRRSYIKKMRQTRSYLFSVDVVWAPIVGTSKRLGNQLKWESTPSQLLLNGTKTLKVIV